MFGLFVTSHRSASSRDQVTSRFLPLIPTFKELTQRVSLFHLKTQMAFMKTYSKVLLPFLKEYREVSNEKGRKTAVNKAVDTVRESKAILEDTENLPKELGTVGPCLFLLIYRLIDNHAGYTPVFHRVHPEGCPP